MSTARAPIANPGPLAGAMAFIVFTVAAVALGHATRAHPRPPDASFIAERELVFKDRADGAVLVYDAEARPERLVDVLEGPNGFLRGVLRGFARSRRAVGLGDEPPFRLLARPDGRLTLVDPSTGRAAELEAFGPDNEEAFARFLPKAAGSGSERAADASDSIMRWR